MRSSLSDVGRRELDAVGVGDHRPRVPRVAERVAERAHLGVVVGVGVGRVDLRQAEVHEPAGDLSYPCGGRRPAPRCPRRRARPPSNPAPSSAVPGRDGLVAGAQRRVAAREVGPDASAPGSRGRRLPSGRADGGCWARRRARIARGRSTRRAAARSRARDRPGVPARRPPQQVPASGARTAPRPPRRAPALPRRRPARGRGYRPVSGNGRHATHPSAVEHLALDGSAVEADDQIKQRSGRSP